ncbi:MAG: L-threonine 3-dehydrogenase [Acidimicrobiales bacterium]
MKALVKTRPAEGLELIEVERPRVGADDVLIDVSHAAICGTDLHIYQWDEWAQSALKPPVTVGHEFIGRVSGLGDQVTGIEVGTRVVAEGHVVCGRCRNCRAGAGHLCRNTVGIGIHRNGGFAEQVVVPATNVYEIPAFVPDEVAVLLDPLGNAVHAALSFDLVGEDILITGAGPIGQMAAAICRHAGARHVVITDIQQTRLETAKKMGATRAVLPGESSLRSTMLELGMTEGFDVALEMSGNPKAVDDILATANHGCKIALLGLAKAATLVDLNQVIFKGLTMKGIYGRQIFETWYKAIAMLDSGLDVQPVISHRFGLADFDAAFDTLASGEASKIILEVCL